MSVGYTDRIIALLGDLDPVTVLNATPLRVSSVVENLVPGDDALRYAAGKWDVRSLLAHLADVEMVTGVRIRRVLSAPGTRLEAFDQDVWAERYPNLEPSLAVEAFRGLRAWNLALLATLTLDDWLAEGLHPVRGPESVDMMVRLLAGHDLNHLLQLDRALAG